jgi:WhiB family redox-sensing transcriptional regulator
LSAVKALSSNWQQDGACRSGMATDFYPPMHAERKHERLARERRAKSVCAACPVQAACLEHAISVDERYGIWGGLNQDERRLLRASA